MRALTFLGPGKLEWREVDAPRLEEDHQALVRPIVAATCDLDTSLVRGQVPVEAPFAFGHEAVAEVLEVGDEVDRVRPGDIVSVPFQLSCGSCPQCAGGRTAHCGVLPPMSMYGLEPFSGKDWGGFLSDVVLVPFADHMLTALPGDLEPKVAASLSDNISDGWRTVAPPLAERPGADVLVVAGANSVSLFATAIALALGASEVHFIGGREREREIAKRLGAGVIDGPFPKRVGSYPITVCGTSNQEAIECAIRSTGPDGVCTNMGIFFGGDAVPVPMFEMYMRGIHFCTGRVHARAVLPQALELIRDGRLDPGMMTSREIHWDQAAEGLADFDAKTVIVRQASAS